VFHGSLTSLAHFIRVCSDLLGGLFINLFRQRRRYETWSCLCVTTEGDVNECRDANILKPHTAKISVYPRIFCGEMWARASLFRRFTNIQTCKEPVPFKCGKLATKYPWIYGYLLQCSNKDNVAAASAMHSLSVCSPAMQSCHFALSPSYYYCQIVAVGAACLPASIVLLSQMSHAICR